MPCTESLILPPGADTPFSFTVPGDKLPYLLEWFNDVKIPGEGAQAFLLRILTEMAVNHRHGKLTASCQEDQRTTAGNYADQLATEQATILP